MTHQETLLNHCVHWARNSTERLAMIAGAAALDEVAALRARVGELEKDIEEMHELYGEALAKLRMLGVSA